MITVPVGQLAPDQQVSFSYEMPQAPGSPAGYTFAAAEQSGAEGSLQALAASPLVTVTPAAPGGGNCPPRTTRPAASPASPPPRYSERMS